MKITSNLFALLLAGGICCTAPVLTSCDDDNTFVAPDSGMLLFADENRAVTLDPKDLNGTIEFTAKMVWTAQPKEETPWLTVSPANGTGGPAVVTFSADPNNTGAPRSTVVVLTAGGQHEEIIVTQGPSEIIILKESDVKDLDKYYKPEEFSSMDMLRSDSKWSWVRSKQSEHFFVFWEAGFGDDPNGETVPAALRVDIDDLLVKAEQIFDTNINKLGMATLGQGKSVLDNHKMEIYLLYQTEWLATGSGYDDMIGALWVNPSTCQPVGSTIAHEIGHSFQYQTYADRVQTQGAPNDFQSGFRYGFVGPDGSGNGGCAYWEQCAQWQAQRDYPIEQFESYNYPVWLANCHRHFHHEWQRYASYWLQSYWVEKHGVDCYGRIWKESNAPEDAISAYTRLYNNGDYAVTREELFDYAARMATYDIAGVREYAAGYQNRYNPSFVMNSTGEYQITYGSCPGATGFNVIPLDVPADGGEVAVNFRGLSYGAPVADNDKSQMVDGDGVAQGKPSSYNAVGGAENMGWRYGFVAVSGETRTYGNVGKDASGRLTFNVPAGTEYLYLVVQGSPETYMSHGWDELESNDPQFPYAITLEGTDLSNYAEAPQAVYTEVDGELRGQLDIKVSVTNEDWIAAHYDIAEKAVADFFGLSPDAIASSMVQPKVGEKQVAQEGKIVVFNQESDGSLSDMPTANLGYWLNADGNAVSWGEGHLVYYEIFGSVLDLGKLGTEAGAAGDVRELRPVFIYTVNGESKIFRMTVRYNFK